MADQFLRVPGNHPALADDDECSECGQRLTRTGDVWLGDAGRYCTRRCAEAHAEFLDSVMRDRARDDKRGD